MREPVLAVPGAGGQTYLTSAGLAAARALMRHAGLSADAAVDAIVAGRPAPRSAERYQRQHGAPASQYTRRPAATDEQLARVQHLRDEAELQAAKDIEAKSVREGRPLPWEQCVAYAQAGGAQHYLRAGDPAEMVEGMRAEADDEAKRTERQQAALDLTKELERYGVSYDEAARLAKENAGRLSGGQHTAAGLARELAAAGGV